MILYFPELGTWFEFMTPNYCGNYPVLGRSADDSVVDNFFSLAANLYF